MASAKKKPRQDEPNDWMVTSNDDSAMGFIRLEVNVSEITPYGVFSPAIEVLGTLWKLQLRKHSDSSLMEFYLFHRVIESNIWSIHVCYEIKLKNFGDGGDRIMKRCKTYNHESNSWGSYTFIHWADLVNEDRGFVKDGKFIIEARITLFRLIGIRVTPRFNFTDSNKPYHDVTFLIGGEKLYASKQILAVYSPVFEAMFYRKFDEKNKTEIELKEIDPKDFIEVLNQIYPTKAMITHPNVETLLKLADRFEIKMILDKVEEFLINSTILMTWKLKLSEQYRLVKLQEHCFGSMKTAKDIKNLKTMDGYKDLSSNIKEMLLTVKNFVVKGRAQTAFKNVDK